MSERNPMLSIIVGDKDKIKDVPFGDRQLIFIPDTRTIALDISGQRTFYNQIENLETELRRKLIHPQNGVFYFVFETAVLWIYQNDRWTALNAPPETVVYMGDDLPVIGKRNGLYINRTAHNISFWNDEIQEYEIVGEKTESIPIGEIITLFEALKEG